MYMAELILKCTISNELAPSADQTSYWLHQPFMESDSKLLLDTMLPNTAPSMALDISGCWVTQSNPGHMDCTMPGFPVLHCLLEFAENHVSCINDAFQPSHTLAPLSCPQTFPASGSFLMSQLFSSGSQSIGASVSTSVLPVSIQGWFPLGWTGLISLLSKEPCHQEPSPAPQFESIHSLVLNLLRTSFVSSPFFFWRSWIIFNIIILNCFSGTLLVSIQLSFWGFILSLHLDHNLLLFHPI